MTLVTLIMFSRYFENDLVKGMTIALTILTIFQWYNIFSVRSHKKSIFSRDLFSNKYLISALILTIGLHLFAIYNPFMQKILHTTGLSLNEWLMMLSIGLVIILVEEIRKFIYKYFSNKKLSLKY